MKPFVLLCLLMDTLPASALNVPAHPRLLLTAPAAAALRGRLEREPDMRAWLGRVREQGEALAKEEPLERIMDGQRLLEVSREALRRILLWGTLHRLDPDPKWVERARVELLAVAAFENWNPSHFLDTAEMAAAVAIGYDWFYDELSEGDRALLEEALLELALKPGLEGGWWVGTDNNWNPVCHGGLSLAALAVAEIHPETAAAILDRARERIPLALASYHPDGVHHESPAYWDYGTGYFILLAMGLQSALGDDWGITEHEGFRKSFDYRMQVVGPSGNVFNYGDGNPAPSLALFHPHMAVRAGRPDWAAFFLNQAQKPAHTPKDRFLPLPLFHWPETNPNTQAPPRDYIGHGHVELASLRGDWEDPNTRWIALRGGKVDVNHAHMDIGSFVAEAHGIRWAVDLGMERAIYARTDAWGTRDGSIRWTFLRAGIHSHNTLLLDGAPQKTSGHCPITADGDAAVAINLTPAYPGKAERITRRVALENERTRFRVTDTLQSPVLEKELRWQMATGAEIELGEDGRTAMLRQGGQSLRIFCHAPAKGARFSIEDLTPDRPEEHPNTGHRLLVLTWPAPLPDPAVIDVELIPGE